MVMMNNMDREDIIELLKKNSATSDTRQTLSEIGLRGGLKRNNLKFGGDIL